jgi:hypothetical protein
MDNKFNRPIFVKTDDKNRVIAIRNNAYSNPDWVRAECEPKNIHRFVRAERNLGSLTDIDGIYRYKLVDNKIVDRTAEEIAADKAAILSKPT